jgi:hypothetical protein
MIQLYLLINGALYLILALWCLLNPKGTSSYLGYHSLNSSGKVEYITVYTGLELGFAAFLFISSFYPGIKLSGLIFCVCIYSGSILIRTVFAIYYGNISKATYLLGGMEYVMGIAGVLLLLKEFKN